MSMDFDSELLLEALGNECVYATYMIEHYFGLNLLIGYSFSLRVCLS